MLCPPIDKSSSLRLPGPMVCTCWAFHYGDSYSKIHLQQKAFTHDDYEGNILSLTHSLEVNMEQLWLYPEPRVRSSPASRAHPVGPYAPWPLLIHPVPAQLFPCSPGLREAWARPLRPRWGVGMKCRTGRDGRLSWEGALDPGRHGCTDYSPKTLAATKDTQWLKTLMLPSGISQCPERSVCLPTDGQSTFAPWPHSQFSPENSVLLEDLVMPVIWAPI